MAPRIRPLANKSGPHMDSGGRAYLGITLSRKMNGKSRRISI